MAYLRWVFARRIYPVTCIKPLKFEKVMQEAAATPANRGPARVDVSKDFDGGSELGGNR